MGFGKERPFSTKSLYNFITDGGATSRVAGYLWKCKIPLKMKIFSGKCSTTNYNILKVLKREAVKGVRSDVYVGSLNQ